MITRYTTLDAAKKDGWLTVREAAEIGNAKSNDVYTTRNPAGDEWGYELWRITEDGQHKIPTTMLSLTDEPNKIGQRGCFVSAIRADDLQRHLQGA